MEGLVLKMGNDKFFQLGVREIWGGSQVFGVGQKDSRQHCYVIGGTGSGKSVLLENFVAQLIGSGCGVGFLDPHGTSARRGLDLVPKHRIKDVIYFDVGDRENPFSFNPLYMGSLLHWLNIVR